MKVLPLSVLFHEGPIARAYLAMLRRSGWRVEQIIRLVPRPGFVSGLLPLSFRTDMATARLQKQANHWPRAFPSAFPGLYQEMVRKISAAFGLNEEFFAEIREDRPLETYGNRVVCVEAAGLKDASVVEALSRRAAPLVLFTGGGILPKPIFDVPGIKLLHVHPGHLPDVRGADGLLWSMMVRGRPGASCFVMQPGLDEGDLLEVQEVPDLVFDIPACETPDDRTLYRMIFSYFDPVLRAHVLSRSIESHPDLAAISGKPQDLSQGLTYHFMESRLRGIALRRLFRQSA